MKTIDLLALLKRPALRQVGTLYGAMIASFIFGIAVSIVNTRVLGPEDYGKYKLLTNLFLFIPSLITFGYFTSVGRLLAQRENEKLRSQILGAGLLVCLYISIFMVALLFGFSFVINDLFNADLSAVLRLFLPLVFTFPLSRYVHSACQGDNRIGILSALYVAPNILYIICVFAVYQFYGTLSLIVVMTMMLGIKALNLTSAMLLLRPRMRGLGPVLSMVQAENRNYGFHIYLGSVGNVASAQLLSLMIGYFVDPTAVGFYGLALAVCTPLTIIGSVIGTTHFKKFASQSAISRKVIIAAYGMVTMASVGFLVLIKPVMTLFYGPEFAPAIPLAYIMGIGCLVHGLGDMYNRFLCAHGKGKEVRNGALLTGIVSLLAGIVLSKYFGALGTTWAKSLTSGTYFLMMMFFYLRRR